MVIIKIKSNYY